MQLASNMAVGLAMFLPAILFPVFLVAYIEYICVCMQV